MKDAVACIVVCYRCCTDAHQPGLMPCQDDEPVPNAQLVAVKAEAATLADATAPAWIPGYPTSRDVQDFAFGFDIQLDEPSTCHYVVVTNTSAASSPVSVAHVLAGTDGAGGTPLASGALTVTTPGSTIAVDISEGVTAWTGYVVYFVALDDAASNTQANVTALPVTTGPDVTPPVWSDGFPLVSGIEDFRFNFTLSLDEPGVVDWLVAPFGLPAPTIAGLRAGTGSVAFGQTAVTGSHESVVVTISGMLTASTAYRVWLLAKDVYGNSQTAIVSVTPTTLPDTTPPLLDGLPTVSNVGDFQVRACALAWLTAGNPPSQSLTRLLCACLWDLAVRHQHCTR